MGTLIDFESSALARLQDRLGRAEAAKGDLAAFARDHRGAAGMIHCAILRAIESDSFEDLIVTVTREWPVLLKVDRVALVLDMAGQGFLAGDKGLGLLDPAIARRWCRAVPEPVMAAVGRGHPGFAADMPHIRCQALLPLESEPPLPSGLLLIGQYDAQPVADGPGRDLLEFLAAGLAAIMRRWLIRT